VTDPMIEETFGQAPEQLVDARNQQRSSRFVCSGRRWQQQKQRTPARRRPS